MVKVPDLPKVYTTKYSEFRGVDFTHDHANVFYKRSPDAVNMRPDESGRPIKRHGWDILITNAILLSTYNEYAEDNSLAEATSIKINLCKYFTLAGKDHVVIFTDKAVFFYDGNLSVKSVDSDCIASYERTFFFEGAGESAFYIYGVYKVWRFSYDGEFKFEQNTYDNTGFSIYVPTVVIAQAPTGGGTKLDDYNLLGNLCAEQFLHNIYSEGVYKVKLLNEVSINDYQKVIVKKGTDFETTLTVITTGNPTSSQCKLVNQDDESYLVFSQAIGDATATEDNIRIIHPTVKVTVTDHTITNTSTATLNNKRES